MKSKFHFEKISDLIAIILFFLAYTIYYWPELVCYCARSGDFALIELEVEKAKHFSAFLGPYSRFHFNHPGPIYFYLLAFVGSLLPGTQCPTSLAQLILNCLFLLWATFLLGKLGVPTLKRYLMLAVLLGTCLLSRDDFLHFIWNPAAIVFPAFLCLISSVGVMNGQRTYLWPQIFAFSVAVQTHLGALPTLGCILIWSWASYALLQPKESGQLQFLIGILVFCVALFSPALYELFHNMEHSNLFRILAFSVNSTPDSDSQHGLGESAKYIMRFYFTPLNVASSLYTRSFLTFLMVATLFKRFEGPGHRKVSRIYMQLWELVKRRKTGGQNRFNKLSQLDPQDSRPQEKKTFQCPVESGSWQKQLRIIWTVGTVSAILAATKISGRQYSYLMWYQIGLVAIFYVLVASCIPSAITTIFTRRPYVPIGLVMGVYVWLGFLLATTPPEVKSCRATPQFNLALEHDTLYRLHFGDRRYWPNAASYVLKVFRAGYKICVPDEWGFLFGRDLTCQNILESAGGSLPASKVRVLSVGGQETPAGYIKLRPGLYLSNP